MKLKDSGKIREYSRRQYLLTAVLMISMLSESVFFAFNALIGRVYGGSGTLGMYRLYLAALLFINIVLWGMKKANTGKIKKMELILLCVPMIYLMLVIATSLKYGGLSGEIRSGTIYLFMWQYMAIFSVLNFQYYSKLDIMANVLDLYVMLIFLGGCRVATQRAAVIGVIETFGGATYQSASYFLSFAFGINTFLLLKQKKMFFLSMLSTEINNMIRLFVSAILTCLVLFSGGRAGIVVIFVYLLVLTIWVWSDRQRFSLNIWVLGVLASIVLLFIVVTVLTDIPAFAASLERVFSYITNHGIDMSETSGRDIIYAAYGRRISERPLLGYGIFSHYYLEEHAPHNMILEILTEGGVIYLIAWLFAFLIIFYKWHHIKSGSKYYMVVMAIYPLIKVMFSGSYLYEELFWVFVAWGFLSNKEWRNKND